MCVGEHVFQWKLRNLRSVSEKIYIVIFLWKKKKNFFSKERLGFSKNFIFWEFKTQIQKMQRIYCTNIIFILEWKYFATWFFVYEGKLITNTIRSIVICKMWIKSNICLEVDHLFECHWFEIVSISRSTFDFVKGTQEKKNFWILVHSLHKNV